MTKYNVEYVYTDPLEKKRYSREGLGKFNRFMNLIYSSDGVEIYQKGETD